MNKEKEDVCMETVVSPAEENQEIKKEIVQQTPPPPPVVRVPVKHTNLGIRSPAM